jgi:hypothetical protein
LLTGLSRSTTIETGTELRKYELRRNLNEERRYCETQCIETGTAEFDLVNRWLHMQAAEIVSGTP